MTKRRTPRLALKALAPLSALALAVSACGGGGGGGGEGDTITIGYSGPLSGGAAFYGENVKTGLDMAVESLNEDGVEIDGKQYTVELKALDDQYLPNNAATNAQRLAEQDDAVVVFIPHSGGIQAAQQLNEGRTPFLIGAYSSDPAVLASGNKLSNMIPPNFNGYAPPFVEQTMSKFGKKLGLLGTESEYGQNWADLVKKEWESQGGTVGRNHGFDYSTVTDYASSVSQALAENPDVLFVGGPSQPTALVIAEAREQGFKGGFIVMDQAKFEEMESFTSPENLVGSVGVRPAYDGDDPGVEAFQEAYRSAHDGKPATSEVAYHYQTLAIYVEAMEAAGTTDDPEAIRDALPEALESLDDKYRVSEMPNVVSDNGHLLSDNLEAIMYEGKDKFTLFPVPAPEE